MALTRSQSVVFTAERNDFCAWVCAREARNAVTVETGATYEKSCLVFAGRSLDHMRVAAADDVTDFITELRFAALLLKQLEIFLSNLTIIRNAGRWYTNACQTTNMRFD